MTAPIYASERATVYVADARTVLPSLPAASVDVLVTDPPYGADWQSGFRKTSFAKIVGDDGSLDVPAVLALAVATLRSNRHVYVFGYDEAALREALRLGGATELIWDKGHNGLGDLTSPWAPAYERITFGTHVKSAAGRSRGDGRLAARLRRSSVIRVGRLNATGVRRHPTEKPVPLLRQLIESSTLPGELVLDPFAGVGSTLVAAVFTGRRAIGIEINESYAAVAAERVRDAERLADAMERA